MKCFDHVTEDAVATCQICGKGLCKACVTEDPRCICQSCAQDLADQQVREAEAQQEQYIQGLLQSRADYKRRMIFGGIFVSLFLVLAICGCASSGYIPPLQAIPSCVFFLIWIFCVPFGWQITKFLSNNSQVQNSGVIITTYRVEAAIWLCKFVAKYLITVFAGPPAFVYHTYQQTKIQKELSYLYPEISN